jgi:hypothetical protein
LTDANGAFAALDAKSLPSFKHAHRDADVLSDERRPHERASRATSGVGAHARSMLIYIRLPIELMNIYL